MENYWHHSAVIRTPGCTSMSPQLHTVCWFLNTSFALSCFIFWREPHYRKSSPPKVSDHTFTNPFAVAALLFHCLHLLNLHLQASSQLTCASHLASGLFNWLIKLEQHRNKCFLSHIMCTYTEFYKQYVNQTERPTSASVLWWISQWGILIENPHKKKGIYKKTQLYLCIAAITWTFSEPNERRVHAQQNPTWEYNNMLEFHQFSGSKEKILQQHKAAFVSINQQKHN